jgi:hypothetical protein
MNRQPTQQELEATVREELAAVGLAPDRIRVQRGESVAWSVELDVGGRHFALGLVQRDGFFCEETTEGRSIDFTSQVDQPLLGHPDRLRLDALRVVRYAVDHPEFRGVVPPVI